MPKESVLSKQNINSIENIQGLNGPIESRQISSMIDVVDTQVKKAPKKQFKHDSTITFLMNGKIKVDKQEKSDKLVSIKLQKIIPQ